MLISVEKNILSINSWVKVEDQRTSAGSHGNQCGLLIGFSDVMNWKGHLLTDMFKIIGSDLLQSWFNANVSEWFQSNNLELLPIA